MNKINTVEKGDKLEMQVFKILKKLLENEEFYLSGKRSKIYLKKDYYSSITKNKINVDIAIETYLPNQKTYSLLTVFECKNYETKIPVEKIRAFSSVLNEIGANKGIIVSKMGFQKGVYDTAKATNVGLCVINRKNELDWINTRLDKKYKQYNITEINSYLFNEIKSDFFAYYNNKHFDNFPKLLINIGVIDKYKNKEEFIKIPYKTEQQIFKEIEKITPNVYINGKLDSDKLIEFIEKQYKAKFIFEQTLDFNNHHKTLGKIKFNPLEIFITKELKNDYYRWRFTLAHEIGHLFLHSKLLSQFIEDNIENEQTIFRYGTGDKINKRMEIQANIFASLLLLPKAPLLKLVKDYFIEIRNYKGRLYLDNQGVNRTLTYNLLSRIKEKFEVSHEVGKYRLISLKLLIDKTDNSIKQILRSI